MLAEEFGANQEHSLEYWNNGMMEQWVQAFIFFAHHSNIPSFLYFLFNPLFHFSLARASISIGLAHGIRVVIGNPQG
jgi:hypothetical protein